MGAFGDKFRKAREKKELSFDDVSNVTKISSRMLRAIEEENFDQLPGGVFNKGFIRAYAKHLGLNDEEAVTDYLACLHQAQIDANEVWDPGHTPEAEKRHFLEPKPPAVKLSPPPRVDELPELQLPRAEDARPPRKKFAIPSKREIPWRILAIAAVVVVLGIILWSRHPRNANTAAANSSSGKAEQPSSSLPATTPPSTTPSSATQHASPPATVAQSSTPNPLPSQTANPATAAHPPAPAPATQPTVETKLNKNEEKNDDVTVRTLASTPSPSTKPAPSLTLVIRATETSWISVLADGQNVSQETLIAPAHASIRATREIVAKIGNAAGVTFLFNGKEIPAEGAEAEVKTFIFDSNGMRVVPSGQSGAPN